MTQPVRSRRTIEAPQYTLADVHALSAAHNEPAWLRAFREQAWATYEALPMPQLTEEAWRRTDYRSVNWREAAPLIAPNGASLSDVPSYNLEPLIGEVKGALIVYADGKLVQHEVPSELAAQGVIFSDLRTAAAQHPELVQQYLMTQAVKADEGKFAALHAALWTHGVFLYVPRGKSVDIPLHVVMYNAHVGATLGHVLVVLEESAQATLLTDYASADGATQSSYIGATELLVGANANLRYVALQDWNRNTYEFNHERARVARDGQLDWIRGTMGSKLSKNFMEVELDGNGAYARVSGMFFADQDQLFDHDTQQNHNAPMTTSDLLFKGAAKDTARSVWQGMIKSLPKMQKIDGFQASRNLLLSDEARMDGIPGLEIEADDVRCTHAATFGTIEDVPVYYLMSRGIERTEAELMVIQGFFDELLERIPFERVRERLYRALVSKIVGTSTAFD
jgi:Fe-S cluster assembly protein SufD